MQLTVNRRFAHGLSFAAAYTYGISLTGNTGLLLHYVYGASGSTPTLWSGQGAYEALNNTLDRRPNFLKFNSTWEAPGVKNMGGFVHKISGLTDVLSDSFVVYHFITSDVKSKRLPCPAATFAKNKGF